VAGAEVEKDRWTFGLAREDNDTAHATFSDVLLRRRLQAD